MRTGFAVSDCIFIQSVRRVGPHKAMLRDCLISLLHPTDIALSQSSEVHIVCRSRSLGEQAMESACYPALFERSHFAFRFEGAECLVTAVDFVIEGYSP